MSGTHRVVWTKLIIEKADSASADNESQDETDQDLKTAFRFRFPVKNLSALAHSGPAPAAGAVMGHTKPDMTATIYAQSQEFKVAELLQ